MGELVIISIYILSTIVVAILMLLTGKYVGELKFFSLGVDPYFIVIQLILTVLGFIVVYFLYKITKSNKKTLFGKKWRVNTSRFNNIFLVFTVSHILFLLITDVGRVGSNASSNISFVFSMINLDAIFGIYYFWARESPNKKFILNIILYIILKLMQGWTGFILSIAMFEVYLYFKRRSKLTIADLFKVIVFPIGMILVGSKLYQYAYALKFYVRFEEKIQLNYIDGLQSLVSRIAFFPITVGANEKFKVIRELYLADNLYFKEILGLFRPILPRFIMPDKEFRTLNNNVIQSFFFDVQESTSANFGILMYAKTLFNINWVEGFVWILCTLLFCVILKRLYNSLELYKGQLDFLYFYLLIQVFSVASLEHVFGYGYFALIYIFPILMLLRIIRVEKGEET